MGKRLNLGCGNSIKEGWVNVDVLEHDNILKWDLDSFPYPFEDNSVEEIYMNHSLEHLEDISKVMKELHRICIPLAKIIINVPHYTYFGAYKDLTHKHYFCYYSLDDYYKLFLVNKKLVFNKYLFLFSWIGNKFPRLFENLLNKYVPCQSLHFELEVLK